MTQLNSLVWNVADETPVIAPLDNGMQMTAKDLTIEDLIDHNALFDAHKRDFFLPASNTHFDVEGKFHAGSDEAFRMDDYALSQANNKFGRAIEMKKDVPDNFSRYLIDYQPENWAPIWSKMADKYGKELFVRTYGSDVRGVMSDRFTHIDNRDVLLAIKEFIDLKGGGRYELVRPYVGVNGMNVRVMFRTQQPEGGSDGNYGMGAVIRCGEIGNISLSAQPFIQRHRCTNSTVWQEGGTVIKQSGNDREYRLYMLKAAIGQAFGVAGALVQKMMQARFIELPSIDAIVGRMAEEYKWPTEIVMAIGAGKENQNTVAGLVNGVTYAAHAVQMPAEKAYEMEVLGGRLLNANYEARR